MQQVKNYIAFRYPNWLDYARHMARVHRFRGWEEDLLNDVICDLLKKPESKLLEMLNAHTRKIVNDAPTTELDKFVLKMLKLNATSTVAPFRKNTLGNKVISRAGGQIKTARHCELNGYDINDEQYDTRLNTRLDTMHQSNIHRLKKNGFTPPAIDLYHHHFIRGQPTSTFTPREQESLETIRQFLTETKKTLLDD